MVSLTELVLLGLAGYRGTQLVVNDTILDPLRDKVFAWHERQPESQVRDKVITLISCTYCTGWWVSGMLLAAWLLVTGEWSQAPLVVHGAEWLAVAGGQALLNSWDNHRAGSSA